jgi:hypothetical protein
MFSRNFNVLPAAAVAELVKKENRTGPKMKGDTEINFCGTYLKRRRGTNRREALPRWSGTF